jgi:hypothetical protein
VRPQIGARFEELIVKLQVEVMRLQIDCCDHRGHRAGEFAEAIENVLRLQRHTFFELIAVDRRGRSDFRGLLPRAGRVRMEGTARTEFARAQRFHCFAHVGKMRRTVPLHDTFESRRIGIRPVLAGVEAESQAWYGRITACAQNAEWVNAVKHPAAEPHRL